MHASLSSLEALLASLFKIVEYSYKTQIQVILGQNCESWKDVGEMMKMMLVNSNHKWNQWQMKIWQS